MNQKTKILIGALATIVGILVSIKFLWPKPNSQSTSFSPTPILSTSTPKPKENLDIYEEQKEINAKYYPLITETPYRTTLFEATYSGPLNLKVIMFSEDQEKIKNKIEEWLIKNGVDPKSHKIEFVKPSAPTLVP